jgi:antitoxin (DNA-binding transcriptional repressor) of toxin-antitoxin stability system
MQQINIYGAKTNLSRLIELASAGEEIIIIAAGNPIAKLTSLEAPPKPRRKGLLKGQIKIREDFDQPLPEEILTGFEDKIAP